MGVESNEYYGNVNLTQALFTWGQIGAAIKAAKYDKAASENQFKAAQQLALREAATAAQSVYVKGGGTAYTGIDLANPAVISEMGGSIPDNPCANALGAAGYTVTIADATHWQIVGVNDKGCGAMKTISLVGG